MASSVPRVRSGAKRNHVRRRKALLQATAVVSLASGEALAAEPVDPFALSPEQLFDATVISASRMPERLGDTPAAIYVLTNEDIARSGATSIPEALRLAPGVQVARVDSSTWAISVRGFNGPLANKLLVLIDGRTVYDTLFSGVYWDVQDTPLEDIERIEVIRGPGASLWGANAVNGVINIITKRASDTQGLLLSLGSGNDDQALINARYGGMAGENAFWRVYGRYTNRAEQKTPFGTMANDEWQSWRGGFRVDWNPNGGGDTVTLQGDVYRSDSNLADAYPLLVPPYVAAAQVDTAAYGGNLLGRWSSRFADGSGLSIQTYLDMTVRSLSSHEEKRTTTLDIDTQYDFPIWGRHAAIAGAGYRHAINDLKYSEMIRGADDSLGEQLISAFVQDKITLAADRWFLTLGSKFEHNDRTGLEIQPNARLQWTDGGLQSAWASVARAVRTPSELEHDITVVVGTIPPGVFPVPVSAEVVPSPEFDSEEVIAYEIGYRRQWTERVLMDISTFYNDYDKLSTFSLMTPYVGANPPLHLVLPIAFTNLTTAKTYGVETVVNWRALNSLNFSAAYSFLKMELDGPPSGVAIASEAAEAQSPRHQFNVRAQWDVSDRVAFDTTLYYVDALPGFSVPTYWRFDTRLGWQLTDRWQVDLVGQNLFDNSHREFGPITEPYAINIGRSVYGKLTWRP